MELWTVLTLGLSLGALHATDADHVAAVATLLKGRGGLLRAARVGGLWGLGHSLTVVLAGGAIVAFRLIIPEAVTQSLELVVAGMLVLLGVRAMRSARLELPEGAESTRGGLTSFGIGIVHGLAGSAAVALAVLTQVRETTVALGYLATFGVGTIAGMGLVTAALSLPFRARADLSRKLRMLAGAASVAVGFAQAYAFGSSLMGA